MCTKYARLGLVCVCLQFLALSPASGDVLLEDLNSTAQFDLDSQDGLVRWTVDGVDHLAKQWFWYRIGDSGPESSIDTLGPATHKTSDGDWDTGYERLAVRYAGTGLTIALDFVLTGGPAGSGASDLAEVIAIQNTGTQTLDLHFFQYVDFDLNGDPADESVEIRGGNTAVQSDGGSTLSETVVTWMPDHCEAGFYDDTLAGLNNATADDLDDTAGPLHSGNLTWAFQWDITLDEGETYIISKDKNLDAVPEPGCLVLLGMGSVVLALRLKKSTVPQDGSPRRAA